MNAGAAQPIYLIIKARSRKALFINFDFPLPPHPCPFTLSISSSLSLHPCLLFSISLPLYFLGSIAFSLTHSLYLFLSSLLLHFFHVISFDLVTSFYVCACLSVSYRVFSFSLFPPIVSLVRFFQSYSHVVKVLLTFFGTSYFFLAQALCWAPFCSLSECVNFFDSFCIVSSEIISAFQVM